MIAPRIVSIDAPAEWAGWPDDRVRCRECRNRTGNGCAKRLPINASDAPFRCAAYSPRNER